jgi:hypothetical protein
MEVIRKAAVVLIFAALVSFVSNFADAEHSASGNRVGPSKTSHWSLVILSDLCFKYVMRCSMESNNKFYYHCYNTDCKYYSYPAFAFCNSPMASDPTPKSHPGSQA